MSVMDTSHEPAMVNEETALLSGRQSTKKPTPLPWMQLSILMLSQLAEPLTGQCISPFLPKMINDLGVTNGDESKVGYYVGIMLSLFFATEAITVMYWSRLSDRIGRKPVLLIGLGGITISMILTGLSKSFPALVLSRSLCGLLNGNVGVAKSAMGELTDKSNRARAFGLMPVIWAAGVTIAPFMGGSLQHPAERFPRYFSNPFWQEYPYFLPCTVSALYAAFAFVAIFLFFEEPSAYMLKHSQRVRPTRSDSTDTLPVTPVETLSKSPIDSPTYEQSGSYFQKKEELKPASLGELLRSDRVRVSVGNYGVVAILEIAYSSLQPLVLASPVAFGGLGLSPPMIGALLGSIGLVNGLFQGLFFASFVERFGPRRLFIAGIACFIPMFLCYPGENYAAWKLGQEGRPLPSLVWVLFAMQAGLLLIMEFAFGTVFVYTTCAAPNKRSLGATNGLAQLIASIVRAIGPTIAAGLFSISTGKNIMGGYFVYVFMVAATFVGLKFATLLPSEPWSLDDDE